MPYKKRGYLKSTLSSLIMLSAGFFGGYQTNQHISSPSSVSFQQGTIQVRFSPKGGCTNLLTQAMFKAKKTLEVAIFDLTSQEIANTLIALHNKGIQVRILADNRQSKGKYSKLSFLYDHGIPVRIAKCSGLMHHKFVIIDHGKQGMLTGSFNYTNGAENKNTENLLWIPSKGLSSSFQNEWQKLWSKSKPYQS